MHLYHFCGLLGNRGQPQKVQYVSEGLVSSPAPPWLGFKLGTVALEGKRVLNV